MSETPQHYQVHEHFFSIQGEGCQAGQTAVFLRLQGCPVGCPWCDAKLTWYAGGTRMTLLAICTAIAAYPRSRLIVITGGEPLLYDLDPLLEMLRQQFLPDRCITIETSGAFPFKGRLRPDHLTVSPKEMRNFYVDPGVLEAATELKYVVDESFEVGVVLDHLRQRSILLRAVYDRLLADTWPVVSLMPEGCPPRPEMVAKTLALLAKWPRLSFSPRLQYNYPEIAAMEGDTNQQISADDARARARARRVTPVP